MKRLVTRSIRFDEKQLNQAHALGVNISEVCRSAVANAIVQKSKPDIKKAYRLLKKKGY